jgi:hypothetical protein
VSAFFYDACTAADQQVLLSPLLTPVRMIRSTLGALKVIDPESANDRVECARIEV